MLLGLTIQEILTVVLPLIGGAIVWLFQSWQQGKKDKLDADTQRSANELSAEAQQNALTFELLQAARTEVAQMREEIAMLRPLQRYVIHLEQALTHIQNIIEAPNQKMKELAEDSARLFLARIKEDTKNTLGK
jgi:small-conductance mechanosensitive channel